MKKKIGAQLEASLQHQLPAHKKYLVACSGGADSLALTEAMYHDGFKMAVAHVEHGIRGEESLQDAAFVRQFCEQRRLTFFCRRIKVREFCQSHKLSLEDGARQLRYQTLAEMAQACGADFIVTAHQQDDQAETLLLKLMQGAGPDGLGSIRLQRGKILHPLLAFTGSQLREYCREEQLSWREDRTNKDKHFNRNRIRLELLPLLRRDFNPRITETLVRTASILQTESDYLQQETLKAAQTCLQQLSDGSVECEGASWYQLHPALRARVLREQWRRLDSGFRLSYEHLQSLQELLLRKHSGKTVCLPGGCRAHYAYGRLLLSKTVRKEKTPHEPAEVSWKQAEKGCVLKFAGGNCKIYVADSPRGVPDKYKAFYPWPQVRKLGSALVFRSRRPGDIFSPYRGRGHKKLQDYLVNQKIPAAQRDGILLAAVGQTILLVCGQRPCAWEDLGTKKITGWLVIELEKGVHSHE